MKCVQGKENAPEKKATNILTQEQELSVHAENLATNIYATSAHPQIHATSASGTCQEISGPLGSCNLKNKEEDVETEGNMIKREKPESLTLLITKKDSKVRSSKNEQQDENQKQEEMNGILIRNLDSIQLNNSNHNPEFVKDLQETSFEHNPKEVLENITITQEISEGKTNIAIMNFEEPPEDHNKININQEALEENLDGIIINQGTLNNDCHVININQEIVKEDHDGTDMKQETLKADHSVFNPNQELLKKDHAEITRNQKTLEENKTTKIQESLKADQDEFDIFEEQTPKESKKLDNTVQITNDNNSIKVKGESRNVRGESDDFFDCLEDQLEDQIEDHLEDQLEYQLEDQFKDHLEDHPEDHLEDHLKDQHKDQLEDHLKVQLADHLKDQHEDQLTDQLKDQLEVQLEDQLKDQLEDHLKDLLTDQPTDLPSYQLSYQLTNQVTHQLEDQTYLGKDQEVKSRSSSNQRDHIKFLETKSESNSNQENAEINERESNSGFEPGFYGYQKTESGYQLNQELQCETKSQSMNHHDEIRSSSSSNKEVLTDDLTALSAENYKVDPVDNILEYEKGECATFLCFETLESETMKHSDNLEKVDKENAENNQRFNDKEDENAVDKTKLKEEFLDLDNIKNMKENVFSREEQNPKEESEREENENIFKEAKDKFSEYSEVVENLQILLYREDKEDKYQRRKEQNNKRKEEFKNNEEKNQNGEIINDNPGKQVSVESEDVEENVERVKDLSAVIDRKRIRDNSSNINLVAVSEQQRFQNPSPTLSKKEEVEDSIAPGPEETESEEEDWNSSEDDLEHAYNTETGCISVSPKSSKQNIDENIKEKGNPNDIERIPIRPNEKKVNTHGSLYPTQPRASLTTSESEMDENIEIKQMKRIKRFKVPSILKRIRRQSNPGDVPDGFNVEHKEKEKKKQKLLPNLNTSYFKRFRRKTTTDIPVIAQPIEIKPDNSRLTYLRKEPEIGISNRMEAETIKVTIRERDKQTELRLRSVKEKLPGSIAVRRTQSLSDATVRPTSFKPKSMSSKFATLGRESSKTISNRFSWLGSTGSAFSTGSTTRSSGSSGSTGRKGSTGSIGQDYENIRYKVGQSSFYIFSDPGSILSLDTVSLNPNGARRTSLNSITASELSSETLRDHGKNTISLTSKEYPKCSESETDYFSVESGSERDNPEPDLDSDPETEFEDFLEFNENHEHQSLELSEESDSDRLDSPCTVISEEHRDINLGKSEENELCEKLSVNSNTSDDNIESLDTDPVYIHIQPKLQDSVIEPCEKYTDSDSLETPTVYSKEYDDVFEDELTKLSNTSSDTIEYTSDVVIEQLGTQTDAEDKHIENINSYSVESNQITSKRREVECESETERIKSEFEIPFRNRSETEIQLRSGSDSNIPDISGAKADISDGSGPESDIPNISGAKADIPDGSGPDSNIPDISGPESDIPDRSGSESDNPDRPESETDALYGSGPESDIPDILGAEADIQDRLRSESVIPDILESEAEIPDDSGPETDIPNESESDIPEGSGSESDIPDGSELSTMLGKKKRFSVSNESLNGDVVSIDPDHSSDTLHSRLSISHPNLYSGEELKPNPKTKRKSIKNPLKKLKNIFRSTPKLTETSVYEEAGLQNNYNQNPIYIASPEEELQEVTGFPGREDRGVRTNLGDTSSQYNPGALTDSDLVSWNWSTHAGSEPGDAVQVCEEETQVGESLINHQFKAMNIRPILETRPQTNLEDETSHVEGDRADFIGLEVSRTEEEVDEGRILSEIESREEKDESRTEKDENKPEEDESMNYMVPIDSKYSVSSSGNHSLETKPENSGATPGNSGAKPENSGAQPGNSEAKPDVISSKESKDQPELEPEARDSVKEFEELEKEVSEQERRDSVIETIDSPRSEPDSEPSSGNKASKGKLEKPTEEPVIAGPMDVALSFNSAWKRRYITVVGDGLYIWTNHRSKTPTARLKLRGLIVNQEKGGTDSEKPVLFLSKKGRIKLVMRADSVPEFQGWFSTLSSTLDTLQESSGESPEKSLEGLKGSKLTPGPGPGSTKVKSDDIKAPGNAENNTEERSRSRPVKKPIPTPRSRSKTPSRENQESPKLSLKSTNDVSSGSSSFHDNLETNDKVQVSGPRDGTDLEVESSGGDSYEKDRLWDEKSAMESVRSLSQVLSSISQEEKTSLKISTFEAKMDFENEDDFPSPGGKALLSLEQSEDSLEIGKVTWSSLSQTKSKTKETISNQGSVLNDGEVSAQGQRIDREDKEVKISASESKLRESKETMRGVEENKSKVPWCTKFIEESSEISFQDSLDEVIETRSCEKIDYYDSDEEHENEDDEGSNSTDESSLEVSIKEKFTPADLVMDTIVEVSEECDTNDEIDDLSFHDHFVKKKVVKPVILHDTDDFAIDLNNIDGEEKQDEPVIITPVSEKKYIPNPIAKPPRQGELGIKSEPGSGFQTHGLVSDINSQGFDFPEIESFDQKDLTREKLKENNKINTFEQVKQEIRNKANDKNRLEAIYKLEEKETLITKQLLSREYTGFTTLSDTQLQNKNKEITDGKPEVKENIEKQTEVKNNTTEQASKIENVGTRTKEYRDKIVKLGDKSVEFGDRNGGFPKTDLDKKANSSENSTKTKEIKAGLADKNTNSKDNKFVLLQNKNKEARGKNVLSEPKSVLYGDTRPIIGEQDLVRRNISVGDEGSSSDEGIGIQDSLKTTEEEIQNKLNAKRESKIYGKDLTLSETVLSDRIYTKNEPKISKKGGKPNNLKINIKQNVTEKRDRSPVYYTAEPKLEVSGYSVKTMARFWEEYRKQVQEEEERLANSVIKKKWNSMPNLKKTETRRLPEVPKPREDFRSLEPEIPEKRVKSSLGDNEDIELCRSVSIKDRKKMFEHLTKKSNLEKGRNWRSMPALDKQNNHPENRVHAYPENRVQGYPEKSRKLNNPSYSRTHGAKSPTRPASTSPYSSSQDYSRTRSSPVRPATVTAYYEDREDERRTSSTTYSRESSFMKVESSVRPVNSSIGQDREDPYTRRSKDMYLRPGSSSSHQGGYRRPPSPAYRSYDMSDEDSDLPSPSSVYSSSSTPSVVQGRRVRYDDLSPGDILFTEQGQRSNRSNISGDEEDSGLYILENGAEFSLTPLNKRKYAFEPYSGSRSGTRDHRRTQSRLNRQEEPGREDLKGLVYSRGVGAVKSPVEVNILPGPVNYVRSSQVPYIEEEKSILENINIVRSAKQRFLN